METLFPTTLPALDVAVFIDPTTHHFLGDVLFDENQMRLGGDNILAPYTHLRQWFADRGIRVHTADHLLEGKCRARQNIYLSMGIFRDASQLLARRDIICSAFFALECPIVEPTLYRQLGAAQRHFRRVFTFSDCDSLRPFLSTAVRCRPFCIPQSFDDVHEDLWGREDRRLLVMINANKLPRLYHQELYTERLRAVEFFSRNGEIDLYGKGWDHTPKRVGKTWLPATLRRWGENLKHAWHQVCPDRLLAAARRVYQGPAESKSKTLGQYTFAICFENMILKGWITEKIFDCFFTGTVPIYWGAPDIADHVPADCFIDMRQFSGYAELRKHLLDLSVDDVRGYKQRARAYLASPAFHRFSKQAFTDLIAEIVSEDAGVTL